MASQPSSLLVIGIGNAIVDVIAQADDAFIAQRKLDKGGMRLIDAAEAEALYAAMGPGTEMSGGSCANTMVGVALLGGAAGYVGRVRDDQLGAVFAHDLRAAGVRFTARPAQDGPPTARCLILVTQDAQRTMNTYLGACIHLQPGDIDAEEIARGEVLYIEGYLWDQPPAKQACRKAMEIAADNGREVALTLSDSFCVDRWRGEFRELVAGPVDILFANESELLSLYQVTDFDVALQRVRQDCRIACLTRSEKGSVIVRGEEVHVIDAMRLGPVVDTTGAGDLYAAGFLYGYRQTGDLALSGRIASLAAGEVISHVGARPQRDLKALLREKLGVR
jgi:sugar/nucleoside kinase (ribokinase family)